MHRVYVSVPSGKASDAVLEEIDRYTCRNLSVSFPVKNRIRIEFETDTPALLELHLRKLLGRRIKVHKMPASAPA